MTDPAARIGQQVGEYKIVGILGEGGMGVVYQAEHAMIGKRVALKMLLSEYAEQPDIIQRFFTEARSVNKIGHRNIIDIFSYGQTPEGTPYFVMELLDGVELAKEIDTKGPMSVERAVNIVRQVASALEASHNAGILHRDLKPENIFLVPPRTPKEPEFVKVFDFGIAKLLEDNEPQLSSKTKTGVIVGTPQYMSPEQVRRQPLDARSDVYALGLILYEMLAGRPPFLADTFPDLIVQIFTKPLPPPQEYNANIPAAIADLNIKMLKLEPAERFQSMTEFIKELDQTEAKLFNLPIDISAKAPSQSEESSRPKTDPKNPLPTIIERPKKPTTLSLSAADVPLTPKPAKTNWLPAALGLVLVLAGTFWFLSASPTTKPQETTTVTAPTPITIEINSTPPGAKVSINNTPLGVTPFQWSTAPSDKEQTIELSLDGFVVKTKTIVPTQNASIELALTPQPTSIQTPTIKDPWSEPIEIKKEPTKKDTTKKPPVVKTNKNTTDNGDPGLQTPDLFKNK